MPKKPTQNKKSAKLENFLKILKKKFSNLADCLFWGFFGMGNSNPKEFFDFNHGKVPYTRLKPQKGIFTSYGVRHCKPFFDHIPEV